MPWLSHVTVPNQPSQLPCYLCMQRVIKICDFIFQLLQCRYKDSCTNFCVDPWFHLSRIETTELNGNSMFEILRNCQNVFLSSCTILQSHQQCMLPMLLMLLASYVKRKSPNLRSQNLLLRFLLNFIISHNHINVCNFELIFMCAVRKGYNFILLHVSTQLSQHLNFCFYYLIFSEIIFSCKHIILKKTSQHTVNVKQV